MKRSRARREFLLVGLGSVFAGLGIPAALAQDPAKVMPRAYRVAFENDRLRVLDFVGRPGMGICGEGMHSHPPHLTIVMADWQGLVSTPDSAAAPRERKFGDVFWSEAQTHKLENTGKTTARVLIVEPKTAGKA